MHIKRQSREPNSLFIRGKRLLRLAQRNVGRAWRQIEIAKLQLVKKAR